VFIYSSSAVQFRDAVDNNQITRQIERAFLEKLGKRPSPGEVKAWNNSMKFMETIIRNSKIADDCGILIEYNIPATSKRIDFIIAGQDTYHKDRFVVVELKQWNTASSTDKQDVVIAFVGGNNREMTHPSYQAWSYRQALSDLNEAIYTNDIQGTSCAYLHNYHESNPEPLKDARYQYIIREAPLFFADDYQQLQQFIHSQVGQGKGINLLYLIENGKIKPSKKLVEHVNALFEGNDSFILFDEQKIAYESIISISQQKSMKKTIIVKGGPGTGKSVVSLNALKEMINQRFNVKFVAPNANFRNVIMEKLAKNKSKGKTRIYNLFSGSSSFFDVPENAFDAIIVDEAHRLKKQGAYQYRGKNQVEDMIRASNLNVFFIDDSQQIRPEDVGSVEEIKKYAKQYYSEVYEIELTAQFRCSGAEGFIHWIDDVLKIKETANATGWDKNAFEFKLMDSPVELYQSIKQKNAQGYNARMLAGYAWPWSSESEGNRNSEIDDVVIEEFGFQMPWNSRKNNFLWAIEDAGMEQIGCVHTSQGLEFDYVGVIIGYDLKFNGDSYQLIADYHEYKDKPGKKGLKNNPDQLTALVKQIYRILISRGMKGCYLFCRDKQLQAYVKQRLEITNN
jgi:DUF2075 family protein